jgi:hypothetical protein
MKTVLILVLSHDKHPYDRMVDTALDTWDSVDVEGTQTVFYFDGTRHNKEKFIYLNVDSGILSMGRKTLAAFEYVLNNYKFDYIARVHSSIYVQKERLIEYVQTLPDKDFFAGSVADSANQFKYIWGGTGFIISHDVINKIVLNKIHWQHKYMEDESMSRLVNWLSITFSPGKAGAIDNMGENWRCISYGGESISFTDFSDLKKLNHHFYRVKQDGKRWVDEFIMKELFRAL